MIYNNQSRSRESAKKAKELPELLFEHISGLFEEIVFSNACITIRYLVLEEHNMRLTGLITTFHWHQEVTAEICKNRDEGR